MPQIFKKIGREKIEENLYEIGFQLIKTFGLKKTSVAKISSQAGIATGTFYNFFASKEDFIYKLMIFKRKSVKEKFQKLSQAGSIKKEDFRIYLKEIYLEDNNIFDYFTEKDIVTLSAKWNTENWKSEKNDELTTTMILSRLTGLNDNVDWKVYANLSKSIALIRFGKSRLYVNEYEQTLDIYIDAIIRYLFV